MAFSSMLWFFVYYSVYAGVCYSIYSRERLDNLQRIHYVQNESSTAAAGCMQVTQQLLAPTTCRSVINEHMRHVRTHASTELHTPK